MVQFAARTHAGLSGEDNQDHLAWNADRARFVVADGMGGLQFGDKASQIVCRVLIDRGLRSPLHRAVSAAHSELVKEAQSRRARMGSTVVAADFSWGRCRIAWVGDSRAYLWRSGRLMCLTRDDNLEFPGANSETPRRSMNEGQHVLTKALGIDNPSPTVVIHRLLAHDWILLCTDGLTKVLEDRAIEQILRTSNNLEEASDELIARTLVGGAPDNVSVLLIDSGPRARLLERMRLILTRSRRSADAADGGSSGMLSEQI